MNEAWPLALAHLRLVAMSVAAALVIGVALGLVSLRHPRAERLAVGAASLVQAIPGIALLAVMVPLLAGAAHAFHLPISAIGPLPAFMALTLYALLPIVRGIVVGVSGIERPIIQAAAAVGMTDRERLRLVELPLAAPAILAGLRTAVVWTVGMATLGTPVGAASLGNLIFGGLQTRNYDWVALGCALAAGTALALDAAIAFAERRARGPGGARTLAVTFAAVLGAGLVAALSGVVGSGGERPMRIGAKAFTEQLVLAELIKCASGGRDAEVRPSLGTTVAFDALRSGDLDVYVEYTGTAWTTIMKREGVAQRSVMLDDVTRALGAEHRVRVIAPLGFENAYALVVRGTDTARTAADLGGAERRYGGDYEFFGRREWADLRRSYGLVATETRAMDPSLMYEALATGAVDVIAGYTTDGRIETMHLRALGDPKGAIMPYDAIVIASESFASARPEVIARLAKLTGSVDVATMRRWNAAVDGGRAPREVVREHPACR